MPERFLDFLRGIASRAAPLLRSAADAGTVPAVSVKLHSGDDPVVVAAAFVRDFRTAH